jgi:hypothetical protein
MAYSFFLQEHKLPKNRTQHDLTVLRNSVLSSKDDIYQQLTVNAEVVEGLSSQLRTSLKRLQIATTLPSHEKIVAMGQAWLDERQTEINALFLRLYMDRVAKDFNSFKIEKGKLILLAHLSQRQSVDVLEMNMKLAHVMEASQIHIDQSIGKQTDNNTSKMKRRIKDILDQNRALLRNSIQWLLLFKIISIKITSP